MTGTWQEVETFGGDKSYESPVFTYDGAATIYLNPEDGEGAGITLRVASDIRASASVHLTIAETRELANWLMRGAQAVEDEL
jgi:hypothetical protein